MPLQQVVESIALHKMQHLILPHGKEGDVCFVLTADTLSQDVHGGIQGKPINKHDAFEKIKVAREGSQLCTAFCLDKKRFVNGVWEVEQRIARSVHAAYLFDIPDALIEDYFEHSIGYSCSNAIAIEGYGSRYLKWVDGSYTAIVGLPLYEVRQALEEVGFF